MQKLSWTFMLVCTLMISCTQKVDHKGKTPMFEVDGVFLYREDVMSILPPRFSSADSAVFVDKYVRNWIEDVLFYEQAEHNIPDNHVLEERVAQYRKALILHSYQQELIRQKLSLELTEKEVRDYFETNQQLSHVEYPLMKGLFIKVPVSAPKIAQVRKWYKSDKQSAVESLEKYSLQHAVKYEYFYDKWLPVSEVLSLLPSKREETEKMLAPEAAIEQSDSAYHYFLHVTDVLPKGSAIPFEYAEQRVREVLANIKKADFLREVRMDLYEEAIRNNRIKKYN